MQSAPLYPHNSACRIIVINDDYARTHIPEPEKETHSHKHYASALQLAFGEQRGVFTIPSDANVHYLTRINVLPTVKGQLTISNASQLEKKRGRKYPQTVFLTIF